MQNKKQYQVHYSTKGEEMKLSNFEIFLSALEVLHFPVETMTFKEMKTELLKLEKYFFPYGINQ